MNFKRFLTRRRAPVERVEPVRHIGFAPSIITADVDIEGHLHSAGELQIDGNVHGDVRAHAAVIDVNGVVHGCVVAEEVVVRGRVVGPIRGIDVHLLTGAHVQGDVISITLSIDKGAWLEGEAHHSSSPFDDPTGRLRWSHDLDPAGPAALPGGEGHAVKNPLFRPLSARRKVAE